MTSIQKSKAFIRYSAIVMFCASIISAHPASAAVSNATSCSQVSSQVSSCQSDSSISGVNAGETACSNVGLDYFPACNESRCPVPGSNPTRYGYACGTITAATSNSTAAPDYCLTQGHECIADTSTCAAGYTVNQTCRNACGANRSYCEPLNTASSGSNSTTTNGSGATTVNGCAPGFVKQSGVCFPTNTGLAETPIALILQNFFSWLLFIFGFLAIGAFIISGVQYLIAAGDEDTVKVAKRNMKWSIVGVLVGLSGWIIMKAISNALTGTNPFF